MRIILKDASLDSSVGLPGALGWRWDCTSDGSAANFGYRRGSLASLARIRTVEGGNDPQPRSNGYQHVDTPESGGPKVPPTREARADEEKRWREGQKWFAASPELLLRR